MRKVLAVAGIFILLLFLGCRRDLERPTWDVDALAPLAYTNVTLLDAVADSLIDSTQDGRLNLNYESNLFSYKLDSLFSIPDTSTTEFFSLPIGTITVPPGQTIFSDTQETQYNLEDIELKLAIIRSGEIKLNLTNTISEDLIFDYSLPFATLNGVPFSISETVPAAIGGNISTISTTYDLSDYEIDFTGSNGNTFNTLVSGFRVYVSPTGNPVTINAGNYVEIESEYLGIIPNYARGYFGNRTVTVGPEFTSLDVFQNVPAGNAQFEQASLQLDINNELGIDFTANIGRFSASKNNSRVDLQHSITEAPVNLTRATETIYQTSYSPSSYSENVDQTNSNITDFLGIFPDSLGYEIELLVNPLGNISGGNDFVFYNSGLELSAKLNVPLEFNASNILILDTTQFNLDEDTRTTTDNINGGTLWLRAENDYPLDATVQIVTLDVNNQVLDTLVSQPDLIRAGIPNAAGRVVEPTTSRVAIPLNQSKTQRLYQAENLIFIIRLNSIDNIPSVIYEDYQMELKLIGDFDYRIDLNEI